MEYRQTFGVSNAYSVEELLESVASPAVQQADAMQQELPLHIFFLQKVAKQVYSQWIQGLKSE
jgi:hypothetical protein